MTTENELELDAANKKVKIRGSDILTTVIGMLLGAGISGLGALFYFHDVAAKDNAVVVAKALKETTDENKKALSEANERLVRALDNLTTEVKRGNESSREQACLLGLPQDRRVNSIDFCKRMARENR